MRRDNHPGPGDDDAHAMGHIHLCPNGCVCLSFGVASVHLQPAQLRGLLGAMLEVAEMLGLELPVRAAVPTPAGARH